MRLEGEPKEAIFIERLSRFSALVRLQGKKEVVYLPNSGRVWQLLVRGQKVFLVQRSGQQRKLQWDLYLFLLGQTLVWADARAANTLIAEALQGNLLPRFSGFTSVRREVAYRDNRLDFLLSSNSEKLLLEAKSVTLVEQGVALFPDAPTKRGARQLRALMQARDEGFQCAVVFVVQRGDAQSLAPNDVIDPEFGRALREARGKGVEVYAYRCQVNTQEIRLAEEVPVSL